MGQAEANLASLIESTDNLIWSVDREHRLMTFNRAMQEDIEKNYKKKVEMGVRLEDILLPERAERWPEIYEKALREGAYRTEYQLLDGRTLELSLNAILVDGDATGISVFGKDVTERKAAEAAQAFLASIVENTDDGIIAYTTSGEILTWNRGAEAIFGYSADEAVGKPMTMVVVPERRAALKEYTEKLLIGTSSLHRQGVGIRKDGRRIHVAVTSGVLRNSAGEATAISCIVRDASSRIEHQETLSFLASIVESSDDSIHAADLSGKILSWNRASEKLFGYQSEEVVGQNATILVAKEHRAKIKKGLSAIRKGHSIGPLEVVLRHKDGRVLEVLQTMTPIRDGEGVIVGAAVIARDIRQKKWFEQAIKDAQTKYREIFDGAIEGIFQTTPKARVLSANRALAEMLGYDSPEEFVATVTDVVSQVWVNEAEHAEAMRQLKAHGEVRNFECQFRRKDGEITRVALTARRICGADGELAYYEGFIADIQQRKAAERGLAAAQEALLRSEARYRTAFLTSIDSININRLEDGLYIDANQAFLDVTGFDRAEVIGRTTREVNIWVDPEDRLRIIEALHRAGSCRDFKARYRVKDGKILWGLMSASVFELDGAACVLSITRDITEAMAAEERLTAAAKALRMSEERYRTVFQTSLDFVAINRFSDGLYIDCNEAFLDTFGYTREEVIGRTSVELGIWADDRGRQRFVERLRETPQCRNLDARLRRKNGELFSALTSASVMELEGVKCIISITRDISEAKAAEDEIRSLAFFDPLTGLPNRRLLIERLHHSLSTITRGNRKRALLHIDLDHFKMVNETQGHQAGDLLLLEASRRITACVHEADTVARLGGDEFAVLLEDLSDQAEDAAAQARLIAEMILSVVGQSYLVEERECRSSCSIGITVFGSAEDNVNEVLKQADIAMYQAKVAGRNNLHFFSPALQAAVNTRAALEEDLRQGIEAGQFLLYYQAQVGGSAVIGAETLLRWNHPTRGILSPDEFIPLAEETGLIVTLGDWVIGAASRQIAAWASDPLTAHLEISVNISARQFRQVDFVERVARTVKESGANPCNLMLELTESMLLENIDEVIAKMSKLKARGLRFSLDDFGTGYSSLSYLKHLPLDQLKIDRSFVRDVLVDSSSSAIAAAILSLSHAMGLSVIAEGVETREQQELLARLGCHLYQGNLFSVPVPAEEFLQLLDRSA